MAKKAMIVDGVNADAVQEFAPLTRGGTIARDYVAECEVAKHPVRVFITESSKKPGTFYSNVDDGLDWLFGASRMPRSALDVYNLVSGARQLLDADATRLLKTLLKGIGEEQARTGNGRLNAIKHRSAQNAGNRADAAAVEAYHTQANASAIAQAVAATLAGLGIVAPVGKTVDETA